ncbi:hypothetical protein HK096_003853 [Nowakowskiella sp. JEL0078]|nr:hypothetical protein HK096_003853 [Nowakowskiella sp. JEL0078]
MKLRFRTWPGAIIVEISPTLGNVVLLEIPQHNLVSGYGGKLSKFLHIHSDPTIFDLYLTLDVAPMVFRSQHGSVQGADEFGENVLQALNEVIVHDTREMRAVDWTGPMEALGLHRSNVYKFTVKTDEVNRWLQDVGNFSPYRKLRVYPRSHLIEMKPLVSPDVLAQFKAMLYMIKSFPVAYHLEVMVSARVFFPEEIIASGKMLEVIQRHIEEGKEQLVVDALCDLFTNRGLSFNPTDPRHRRPITFFKQFLDKATFQKRRLFRTTTVAPASSPDFITVYSATVTPMTVFIEKPTVEQGNRVLRNYRRIADRFLRVNFSEEDGSRLRCPYELYLKEIIEDRIKKVMRDGLEIAGRRYEFLGFSSSQLREHGIWMFNSDDSLNASDIRRWMGNFSEIKIPAKFAARMGQCFTTTFSTMEIEKNSVKTIPDVVIGRYIFTDGIGKISPSLLEKALAYHRSTWVYRESEPPSAYQIRFGGCKGMVAVDPTLKGDELHIRPSMRKFDAPTSHNFEIVKTSRIARQAYLNRQLILILSHLQIPDAVFLELQNQHRIDLNLIATNKEVALKILLMGVGGARKLQ